jgi:mannitol 2-dehydrogenase
MAALTGASVAELGSRIAVPAYDRNSVKAGIVHFGVGGFHRGHEAVYLDTLMNRGQALDWGICGIGLLPADRRMRDVLAAQDRLYTVVVKHPDGTWEPRVIGSIVDYLYAPDDPAAVLAKLTSPDIRVVSLTITEGGYNIDEATGTFDATAPAVAADLRSGAPPRSVFGLVTRALDQRRRAGTAPFTVVSCDNIPANGEVARKAFASFARLTDPDLGRWIEATVRFPSSMVDRITPATTDDDRTELARRFGVDDGWPVVCEPFTQWVLEDSFTGDRPPLEKVGVQIVGDIDPYESMKLRLLNGSHQALGYAGYLSGYRLVHEVTRDPLFSDFLLGYMAEEAIPTLAPVPGIDVGDYSHQLIARFSNPEVADTVARLCAYSSDRIPKFVLPVIRQQLRTGSPFGRGATVIACWARYAEGVDEQGAPIEIVDSRAERLVASARRQRLDPTAFLENRDIFGDLVDDDRFTAMYVEVLESLHERGVRATLGDLARLERRSLARTGTGDTGPSPHDTEAR